jgi:hypothetical protein
LNFFHNITALPTLLFGSECWKAKGKTRITITKVKFVRLSEEIHLDAFSKRGEVRKLDDELMLKP